jgi:hypothetical protein
MTYALLLAFFRNDMGFGGNNGLTDFKDILGFNVQADGTRAALFALSCCRADRSASCHRRHRHLEIGKVLIAVRDAESARASSATGSRTYKLFVFTVSACMAGVAGALYVPQVGIINPGEFALPTRSRRDLGRGRRARHAGRRGARRGRGQLRQDLCSPAAPCRLLAVCSRRAVHSVTLFCPRASSAPGTGAEAKGTIAQAAAKRGDAGVTKPALAAK